MAAPTREDVRDYLVKLIIDELGTEVAPDAITEGVVLKQLVPDSVSRSDLLGMVRRRYKISREDFSDEEARMLATVGDMIDVVEQMAA